VREFARRKSELDLNARDSQVAEASDVRPASLKRFFHGWLREAVPVEEKRHDDTDTGIRRLSKAESGVVTRLTLRSSRQAEPPKPSRSILTIREVLGLARATVRESETHRTWPPDVVLKFQAAKVVTRRSRK
jgi:hypothetical protein